MIPQRAVFAYFPYLVTQERVRIRGIEFRSNQDIADLPADVQEHITILSQMFFLEHGVRIEKMTCCYLELPEDKKEQQSALRRLYEARLLVGYLYSHPRPSGGVFLPFENSTLWVFRFGDLFQPSMIPTCFIWHGKEHGDRVKEVDSRQIPSEEYTPGYYGTRDQKAQVAVAKGSRIFPETPHVVLNFSQDLYMNLEMLFSNAQHWALYHFYFDHFDDLRDLRKRVLVSLDWYMKSCRDSLDEAEAIVHLAIALESLLNVRSDEEKDDTDKGKGKVTERFKGAVLTLLGPVTRLDKWIDQFYTARSKAVHEGMPHDTMFCPFDKDVLKNKKKEGEPIIPHRSLLEYGRRIFRICVSSVLAGALHARISRLDALFVPNAERVDEICKLLKQKVPADKRLFSIGQSVDELIDYGYDLVDPDVVSVDSVVGAVKLALQAYKEAVQTITESSKEAIDKIVVTSGDPAVALLEQIEECARQLRYDKNVMTDQSPATQPTRIMIALLDYASNPSFKLQCYYRENPRLV